MNELIGQLASKASGDFFVAEKSIGLMLGRLRSERPSDQAEALIDRRSGAETAMAPAITGAGLDRSMSHGTREIQSIAGELFRFSQDKIGAEQMGEIIASTPGLSQFA